MINLSVIVPTIRPHLWERFLESLKKSCKDAKYEVIFVGPFCDEAFLSEGVRFIKSFANPTTCFHLGVRESIYECLFFTSDDSVFFENSVDKCVADYTAYLNGKLAALNCRYREGVNFGKYEFPMQYWLAGTYPNVYGQRYINPNWSLALQTIVDKRAFVDFGGFDCAFQFSNHAHADFSFRVQRAGGIIAQSSVEVANLEHLSSDKDGHRPVELAQNGDDANRFEEIWQNNPRTYIIFDNYKDYLYNWRLRFKEEYSSFGEMISKYESK